MTAQAPPPALDLPGAIVDPLWGYVTASYVIAAASLVLLVAYSLWNARRWAKRAKDAAAREQAARQ